MAHLPQSPYTCSELVNVERETYVVFGDVVVWLNGEIHVEYFQFVCASASTAYTCAVHVHMHTNHVHVNVHVHVIYMCTHD